MNKIILVTDCVSRVSHNPADYPQDSPMSAPDLNFNERGGLSGSRLVVAQSVAKFMEVTGADVRVGFKVGSTNSAKALDLYDNYGSIHAGKFANLVFVDEKFQVKSVIFKGEQLEEVRN